MIILFLPMGIRFFSVRWRLSGNNSELKMSGLSHEYQYLSETATAIIGTWPISTQFSVSRIIVEQSGYFTWTCSPESRYFVQPVRSRVQESGRAGSWPDVAHLTLCNTGRISLLANSFECLMISWFKSSGRLILRGSCSSEGSTLILSRFNSSRACFTLSRDLQTAKKNKLPVNVIPAFMLCYFRFLIPK